MRPAVGTGGHRTDTACRDKMSTSGSAAPFVPRSRHCPALRRLWSRPADSTDVRGISEIPRLVCSGVGHFVSKRERPGDQQAGCQLGEFVLAGSLGTQPGRQGREGKADSDKMSTLVRECAVRGASFLATATPACSSRFKRSEQSRGDGLVAYARLTFVDRPREEVDCECPPDGCTACHLVDNGRRP